MISLFLKFTYFKSFCLIHSANTVFKIEQELTREASKSVS